MFSIERELHFLSPFIPPSSPSYPSSNLPMRLHSQGDTLSFFDYICYMHMCMHKYTPKQPSEFRFVVLHACGFKADHAAWDNPRGSPGGCL